MATLGGAAVLNRTDIGALAVGKRADFFSVDLNKVGYAGGSMLDPVAAVVFCAAQSASNTVVNGRFVVKDGQMVTLDLPVAIERCNAAARLMING
jgi:cytosine/adenosine deaminase-related metal-dependent hydrolase